MPERIEVHIPRHMLVLALPQPIVSLPLHVPPLHLLLAVPVGILLAFDRPRHEIAVLDRRLFTASRLHLRCVGINRSLWDKCQLRKDGRVPLDDVLLFAVVSFAPTIKDKNG